jgi:hypothetical protein
MVMSCAEGKVEMSGMDTSGGICTEAPGSAGRPNASAALPYWSRNSDTPRSTYPFFSAYTPAATPTEILQVMRRGVCVRERRFGVKCAFERTAGWRAFLFRVWSHAFTHTHTPLVCEIKCFCPRAKKVVIFLSRVGGEGKRRERR